MIKVWVRGGWVRSGLITFFNIYISHVKKLQNEKRGAYPRIVFFEKRSTYHCLHITYIHVNSHMYMHIHTYIHI